MDNKLILPTQQQIEWADCEIGVIIHMDMFTFVNMHYEDPPPPVSTFNPEELDTDQWLEAAAAMGAKYAVFVAKHCSGFSMWPTEAHKYSVKHSPFKNGTGDIVADFFASCKKYGLRPGLYCSLQCNSYYDVELPCHHRSGDPKKQQEYYEMCMKQLTELWTRYGDIFEIWFDGGVPPISEGGPDVAGLLHNLQPNSVVFQGPLGTSSLVRWGGNERAEVSENCSSIFRFRTQRNDGLSDQEYLGYGNQDGDTWAPVEADTPNRDASRAYMQGWFWQPDEDNTVFPAEYLFDRYLKSVGRNCNLLIGMPIDNRGLFPEADKKEFLRFAEIRNRIFGNPLSESIDNCKSVELKCDNSAGYVAFGEDISKGERVRGYIMRGFDSTDNEVFKYEGKVIGHKRILELPEDVKKVTLEITSSVAEPKMKFLQLFGKL